MPVISFNLTKIHADRLKAKTAGTTVKRDIKIDNVQLMDLDVTKSKVLKVDFTSRFVYEPDLGSIEMSGDLLFLDKETMLKEIEADYTKNKKMDPRLTELFLNNILGRTNLESMVLSDKVGLPMPIRFPQARILNNEENVAAAKSEGKSKAKKK